MTEPGFELQTDHTEVPISHSTSSEKPSWIASAYSFIHSFTSCYHCSMPSVVLGKAGDQDRPSGAQKLVGKTDTQMSIPNSLINAKTKRRRHSG